MNVDKKEFWENKIIGWEDIRYKSLPNNQSFFEKFVNKTNKTLIFRLNTALEILKPLIKGKKLLNLAVALVF